MKPVLSVKNLSIAFKSGLDLVQVVNNVSFNLFPGETLALVGESGSGKSITALSILQLLPKSANIKSGSIKFLEDELLGKTESEMRAIRARKIGIIFQEPMTSLNPLQSIEKQIGEVIQTHSSIPRLAIKARVIELLEMVGLDDALERLHSLPHELSGGQRQRIMIAMSLAVEPDILIADEPTTALDITIQSQILDLLKELKGRLGMSIVFITHDLSIVKNFSDRVCVLEKGNIIEEGNVKKIFTSADHPYTNKLILSQPVVKERKRTNNSPELLRVNNLKVWFPIKMGLIRRKVGYVKAVNDLSFFMNRNETLGVVGESGSGKTTLGFALLRLVKSIGDINFDGTEISKASKRQMQFLRKKMQIVFQDPYSSLSPRLSVSQIIGEALDLHNKDLDVKDKIDLIYNVLKDVGLTYSCMDRFPHEFSGGQRQRIAIARALVLKPQFLVLDEPTSALDVSIQAQIIELLHELQSKYGLSYLFISHDLRVVRSLADKILVMKNGIAVEQGTSENIFTSPKNTYTQSLIKSFSSM